jgi:hypothetical protein
LILVVRPEVIELWHSAPSKAPPGDENTAPAADPRPAETTLAGEAKGARLRERLRAVLQRECAREHGCTPALLQISGDAPFSMVRAALEEHAAAVGVLGQQPILDLRATEPGAAGVAPPARHAPLTVVSGRLHPSVIQRIVRQNYASFRECYEAGLGRDPKLSGRVSARFVIDRGGLVSAVSIAKEGTTIPDEAVVNCVAEAFRHLTFPKPDGGIVTVVYPIQFEPGD